MWYGIVHTYYIPGINSDHIDQYYIVARMSVLFMIHMSYYCVYVLELLYVILMAS